MTHPTKEELDSIYAKAFELGYRNAQMDCTIAFRADGLQAVKLWMDHGTDWSEYIFPQVKPKECNS